MMTYSKSVRRADFDYLRSCAVLLVLWHHATLAYSSLMVLIEESPLWQFNPVKHPVNWVPFDVLIVVNDRYFMPLLFFVAGLFVWTSLQRKGLRTYLKERLARLGIPFLVIWLLVMPVAFWPGRLNHERVFGSEVPGLWEHWLESVMSSAGPLWFVWVLMIFSVLASVWCRYRPEMGEWLRRRASRTFEGPWRFFGLLLGVSFAAYLPMAVVFGEGRWIGLGSFAIQVSRVLLYLTYFAFGVAVGAYGHHRTFLRSDGPLARRWWLWVLLALVVSAASLFMPFVGFPFGCAFLIFAAIAVFVRFATRRIGVLDNLSENAYGIYLLHYLFVGWLQWGLYDSGIPVPTQGLLVFVGTVALSWGVTAVVRRIPAVARIV